MFKNLIGWLLFDKLTYWLLLYFYKDLEATSVWLKNMKNKNIVR